MFSLGNFLTGGGGGDIMGHGGVPMGVLQGQALPSEGSSALFVEIFLKVKAL